MIRMSIGAAFSETFAFLKANWMQMLMWVGGALILVGLLGYLFLGSTFTAMAMAPNDPTLIMGAFGQIGLFALIAALSTRMVWDAARQVTGQAEAMQIEGARRLQTLNIGGSCATVVSFVVEQGA